MRKTLQPQRAPKTIIDRILRTFPFHGGNTRSAFLAQAKRAEKSIAKVQDPNAVFAILRDLVASLRNGHTFLSRPVTTYRPREYNVVEAAGRYYLRRRRKVVDELLRINQVPVCRVITQRIHESYDHLSPRFAAYLARQSLLAATVRMPLQLEHRSGRQTRTLVVSIEKSRKRAVPTISLVKVKEGLWCLKIISWANGRLTMRDIDRVIRQLLSRHPLGLIIDIRGNGGGNSDFAKRLVEHLLLKPAHLGTVHQRRTGQKTFRTRKFVIQPRRPNISCPVAVLMDAGCFSTSEYFLSALRESGRAVLIGRRSAGGSGNPVRSQIRYGGEKWTLSISRWYFTFPNGKVIERKGIKPDITTEQSALDWRTRVDRDKVVAVKWIQQRQRKK